jgi:5-formyltetrahydrofolate cyclo-ligase
MSSHHLKRRKKALRALVKARREALTLPERTEKSAAITERLLALSEVEAARTVMLFWSFGSEVATAPMVERLSAVGKELVLPRIEGGDIVAAAYRPGDPVHEAWFGAKEPLGTEVVAPSEIDVVVTPGLVFDRSGHRVGYGGGFYDRFLRRVRPDAFKVAVAFGLQVVDEVPHRGGDVPVDAIATEGETIRCR